MKNLKRILTIAMAATVMATSAAPALAQDAQAAETTTEASAEQTTESSSTLDVEAFSSLADSALADSTLTVTASSVNYTYEPTAKKYYSWDSSTKKWDLWSVEKNSYNKKGKLVKYVCRYYDEGKSAGKTTMEYKYNKKGKLKRIKTYYDNNESEAFYAYIKYKNGKISSFVQREDTGYYIYKIKVTYTYNKKNQLVKRTKVSNAKNDKTTEVIRYKYNKKGKLISETTYQDSEKTTATTYKYKDGKLVKESFYSYQDNPTYVQTYTYTYKKGVLRKKVYKAGTAKKLSTVSVTTYNKKGAALKTVNNDSGLVTKNTLYKGLCVKSEIEKKSSKIVYSGFRKVKQSNNAVTVDPLDGLVPEAL